MEEKIDREPTATRPICGKGMRDPSVGEMEALDRDGSCIQGIHAFSHAECALVVERFPIGCMLLDEKGRVSKINFLGAARIGRPRESLTGRPIGTCLDVVSRKAVKEHLRKVFAGATVSAEVRFQSGGGEAVAVKIESSPLGRIGNRPGYALTSLFEAAKGNQTEKDVPQPQVAVALGLEMRKDDPIISST